MSVFYILKVCIFLFQVSILHKPEEFYQTLLDRCKKAQKRIMLASLYLGTGPLEKELVCCNKIGF